jgi:hypothetical protein
LKNIPSFVINFLEVMGEKLMAKALHFFAAYAMYASSSNVRFHVLLLELFSGARMQQKLNDGSSLTEEFANDRRKCASISQYVCLQFK